MKDLSVIIVSYNVSSFLNQALSTLNSASEGLYVEVFVVDNASSDDSVAMVQSKYPHVILIANDTNIGFAKANNQALGQAQGRYILFLNPDTILRRDTLRTMIDFLDNHPEAGAAGCKVINPDGSLQLACRRGFPTPGVAFYKLTGLSDLFPKSKTFGAYHLTYLDQNSLTEVDALSGSFMMVRKETLDKVGYFDGSFFMYGEDIDLCYRIKQAGWKIYYVPATEIIHFKGESTKTVPTLKNIRDFYLAMHIFVEKHYAGHSKIAIPGWLLIAGIYIRMGLVYGFQLLMRARIPLLDLLLLNISFILGIMLRFGVRLEHAPAYTTLQWFSIFIVYSVLYMATFYFIGLYHRYKNVPERALLGIFIGFLFHVFIINFLKQYNFSRIASFYCWGFNSIIISGWRFIYQVAHYRQSRPLTRKAIIVGTISDAVTLKHIFDNSMKYFYSIIGCVEITPDVLRGSSVESVYVLGLIDDLEAVIKDYAIDTVLMVGSNIPFSKILTLSNGIRTIRPEFKLIPELDKRTDVLSNKDTEIPMIDIHAGGVFGYTKK